MRKTKITLSRLLKETAFQTKEMKKQLLEVYQNASNNTVLQKLFTDLQKEAYRELTEEEFLEALAQLAIFVLILAKCKAPQEEITPDTVRKYVPLLTLCTTIIIHLNKLWVIFTASFIAVLITKNTRITSAKNLRESPLFLQRNFLKKCPISVGILFKNIYAKTCLPSG
ncbi:hypothetical protein AGMMS49949_04650 [Alphaproteobacteria bacterium]|nr:hypothetical protein AGMMS49949_04650 [Alphaproteobacteria bacterium]GHS97525.1 hypothetical protein AGMMS50296_4590 [Alphaproteobacteria bacterium]